MEEHTTPPGRDASSTTLSPETKKRIEENRLRAKAIRTRREAEQRVKGAAAPVGGTDAIPFEASEDMYIVNNSNNSNSRNARGRKRRYEDDGDDARRPATNRDGRNTGPSGTGTAEAIRPAAKFTKFVDYDMSAMTDTKGGFLSAEDDVSFRPGASSAKQQPGTATDENARPQHMTAREWERLQVLRSLERNRAGKFEPGISVLDEPEKRKRCRECSSMEIDWVWDDVFHLSVCSRCKERYPEKYSLLTKTECKEDYLLTDPELRDPELLPHLSKPNPHKSHWHDMMLFLRIQVEEYAIRTKWGSAEALDQEYERREAQKKARKEAKFRDKLTELKRKTRTEAFRRQAAVGRGGAGSAAGPSRFGDAVGSAARHVHDWGRIVVNEDGMSVKTCVECGMEVEEMEL